MIIPFNKPYMTGKELWYISQAHANGHLAGDGEFTRRCNAWLEDRIGLMVNAVSSFSSQPLIWLFNIGITITLSSFLYAPYLIIRKLLFDDSLVGFTSVMVLITLSLGILTTAIGGVGVYLGKVYN